MKSFLRYRSLFHVASLGLLGGPFKGLFDDFSPKRRLSVDNCLRRRSLLGALVLRACYVTARSWEPWCSEMFTLPLALGSLGVENCLRNRSLLGALALRACHVTVRCWEPWCEELFALPIALLFGVSGPSWGSF